MLPRDPTALPSLSSFDQPPPPVNFPSNAALCQRCNESLHLDDRVAEPYLRVTRDGVKHLSRLGPYHGGYSVFGGIDYLRHDVLPDLPGLSSDGQSGCHFCAALKRALHEKYGQRNSGRLTLRIQYSWTVDPPFLRLNAVVVSVRWSSLGGCQKGVFQFPIYAARGEDASNAWLNPRRPLEEDLPWSSRNVSMVRGWVRECVSESGSCGHLHAARATDEMLHPRIPFSPTRTLDLCPHLLGCGSHGRPLPDVITLVEVHGRDGTIPDSSRETDFRYAALSYCWGSPSPPVKLTRETIEKHHAGILVSDLPQCLRDAITVARALEVRYLWIDALCIVQDDEEDWEREAEKMYEIFHNAFVTIAAAVSESFDQGFLDRPRRMVDLVFRSSLNADVAGAFSLSLTPHHGEIGTRDEPLEADLRVSKWHTRGWVWQEQSLSRRLLVFGESIIHFKCEHCTRSENGHLKRDDSTAFTEGRWMWQATVSGYSAKDLTNSTDRLPAVSGLAKLMDQHSRSLGQGPALYLAGIWSDEWQLQLCWRLVRQEQSFQDMMRGFRGPDKYVAPSWSWASRHGSVDYSWGGSDGSDRSDGSQGLENPRLGSSADFGARMDSHKIVTTGPDPMGRVRPGSHLCLSGRLCRAPLRPGAGTRLAHRPRTPLEWQAPASAIKYSLDWRCTPEAQEGAELGQDIKMFGLWRDTRAGVCDNFTGLLLVEDEGEGRFHRVGVFRMDLRLWKRLESELPGHFEPRHWPQASVRIF